MAVIVTFSSIPRLELPPIIPYLDKIGHLGEYLILGFLLTRAFLNSGPDIRSAHAVYLSVFVVLFFGAFDEWHQNFIPGRGAETADLIMDVAGSAIGALIYRIKNKR